MGDHEALHFRDEIRAAFASRSREPALAFSDRTYTFAELERKAERSAAWLSGLGVSPGDRVVIASAEKRPFLAAHLGAIFAGAVALPVNPKFTRDEMRHVLADAWDAPAARFNPPDVPADSPALILYSSGTTGRPKGVVHSQANLAGSLRALRACWRFTPDDVLVNVLPLFHIHGLSFATHLSLLTGSRMIVEDAFHPRRTLETIGRGSVFMAIPTFYFAFLDRPEFRRAAKGWAGVRLFTCGSAPIRPEVLPELESILGRPVINRYGMTEGHGITSLPLDGPWPRGSVGLPLDGMEVRVAGDDGEAVPDGAVGTVYLRGPNLFREYWRNPSATRAAFATGWFDTGDVGRLDDGGFLTLVGRKNDMIITNGFNVYPEVVERVINDCPGVKESAVLGMPDDRRGERVTAVVVRGDPAVDERRVKAHCAEHLVDYQRPSTVVFVDDLPRNAMGKVLRRSLRDRLAPGG